MGLTVGPVPARVDASVKAGICDLVEHAVTGGWSARAACHLLEVDDLRVARWAARRAAGQDLADAPRGQPAARAAGLGEGGNRGAVRGLG